MQHAREKLASQLTVHYSLIQGIHWCSFVCIINYLSVFLQSRGFSGTEIGTVTATASTLSIFLQSWLGNLADRNPKINPHNTSLVLSGISIALLAVVWLAPVTKLATAILYVGVLCMMYTVMLFVTAMGYTYINHGIKVNFGLARGIGSITCAVLAALMGSLVSATSADIVLPAAILAYALLMALTITFVPKVRHHGSGAKMTLITPSSAAEEHLTKKTPEKSEKKSSGSIAGFIRKYWAFFLFLAGLVILKCGTQILITYMINIVKGVGGNSTHLGRAVAIQAAMELPTMAISGWLIRKFGSPILLKASAFFFIVKGALLYLATSIGTIYFAQCFQMLSFALLVPVATAYCNEVMADDDKVTGQAMLNVAMVSIPNIVGNLVGGVLLDAFGISSTLQFSIACTAIGFLIFCVTVKKAKKTIV